MVRAAMADPTPLGSSITRDPQRPFRVALTGCRTFFGDRLIRALEDDPRCEHVLAFGTAAAAAAFITYNDPMASSS